MSGGEVEEKAGAKHPSQTGVFDVQRGEENCSGYDNQVAREGRGMCLAKQAAGNETSDGQAAAGVSDMGEQQREEVDSEGRPSLGGRERGQRCSVSTWTRRWWQRLVRWGGVRE